MKILSWRLCALMLALLLPASARAQDETRARSLDPLSRLDPAYRYAVEVLLDSARLSGLPTNPIESKALEGIAKNRNGRQIVIATRDVYRSLVRSRAALGPSATAAELTAGANALRVGITSVELAHLASTRDAGKELTMPLVVLSDLVTRGVARDTASQTIFQLWQKGAADEDFLGLWRGVERDIVSGTDPGVALMNRAREVPNRGPPPTTPPGARSENPETQNR